MTQTAKNIFDSWRTTSDPLEVSADGMLTIEGCPVRQLIDEYDSPLYVMSENTIRHNYRRAKKAFEAVWPADVNVMFAIKSNPNVALRAILSEEGAGGDCFSMGEIEATFRGGADPARIAVNGSFKPDDVIERAITLGLVLNIDAEEEVDNVIRVAKRLGRIARIAIRLKVLDEKYFTTFKPDCFVVPDFSGYMRHCKWGETEAGAARIIHRAGESEWLELVGYHNHLGRASRSPEMWEALQGAYAEMIVALYRKTGFRPDIINIGGGLSRERDPESSSGDISNPNSIEDYADVIARAMLPKFNAAAMLVPHLWLEPGRYIIGNGGVLLTRVVLIKRDEELGLTWVNLDSSTNSLLQIDLYDYDYVVLAAEGMDRPITQRADVVGISCVPSVFSTDTPLPDIKVGEVIVILDAGMYAETKCNQFNSIPRPATVLVNGERHELIRRREMMEDLFVNMLIPDRFDNPTG